MIVSGFSGNEIYCLAQKGWTPGSIVVGNSVQSLGFAGGFSGFLRGVGGGEVRQFSDMYNHIRHLALERLEKEAQERGANAVVDIHTRILPIGTGAREMLMVGTASHHPALGKPDRPVTS